MATRDAWGVIVEATGAGLPRRSALYAERAGACARRHAAVCVMVYIYVISVVCFN
jgi:hypothetical protein